MQRTMMMLCAVLLTAMMVYAGETAVKNDAPKSGKKGAAGSTAARPEPNNVTKIEYPKAEKTDHVDDYNGVKVADPYHWMENLDSPEVKQWVDAENKITFGYLEKIPQREQIKARMTHLWNYERYTTPFKRGGRYFYSKNDGLQNQNVYYVQDSLSGEPRVLLDPNKLSADGTVALSEMAISEDGKTMAYSLAASGSDWVEWHFRNIDTGKDLPDVLKWSKFSSGSFTHDGKALYYSRYDEPKSGNKLENANYYHKLYLHTLGTPQSEDKLVYETPEHKDWLFNGQVTNDGHYLIINVSVGTDQRTRLYYKDLTKPNAPVVKLLDDFDAEYDFVDNDGPVFWIVTDNNAPMMRLIAIDTEHPAKSDWKTVIPETKDKLEGVGAVGGKLIASYLKDAYTQVNVHDESGKLEGSIQLPGIGTAEGFGGERTDNETFFTFQSFTTPPTVYRYEVPTAKASVFRKPKVDFNPDDFEVKQVFYHSKDGTRVPMFLAYKKGIKLDGKNPTYLYGYGGFNISLTPNFVVANLVWMEMGGVYAVANLRGGGEYGTKWHEAGMKHNKQNVFDDFIAAGEWLIKNKYTSTPKLACGGRSNGGLLVGAVLTQRPDLWGATLPGVGVMDMLRFNKFTIGWAWMSDYGNPENPADFAYLRKYSPLHNLKPGTKYPPSLIVTADHDDRVVPAHSFKFVATLQADQGGDAPELIRIETKAGHGAGKPTTKQIEELTDEFAFLVKNLHMHPKLPEPARQ